MRTAPFLPAAVAMFVVLVGCTAIELLERRLAVEQQRSAVAGDLGLIRARLEGALTANIMEVRGLATAITVATDLDQDRFAALAAPLFRDSQLRNIGAAPDMVIRWMYPLAGNEHAIGLDYRTNPLQRAGAERARDTGELVLAGPLQLVQGGEGVIGRLPVFIDGPQGRRFWGLISAVIDCDRLYATAGLDGTGSHVRCVLRGRNGSGAGGEIFHGDAAILEALPVTMDIVVPGGTWQLAGVPVMGWTTGASTIRLLLLVVLAALIVGPMLLVGFLLERRRLAEERYDRLARHSRMVAWEADAAGRIIFASPVAREVWGCDPAEVIGQPLDRLRQAGDVGAFSAAIAAGQAIEELITGLAGHDGVWLATTAAPRRDAAGKIVAWQGSDTDVSQRHRAGLEQSERLRHNRTLAALTIHPDVLAGELDAGMRELVIQSAEAIGAARMSVWLFAEDRSQLHCLALRTDTGVTLHEGVLSANDHPAYFAAIASQAVVSAEDAMMDPRTSTFADGYLKPLGIGAILDVVVPGNDGVAGVMCVEHVGGRRNWTTAEQGFVVSLGHIAGAIIGAWRRRELIVQLERAREAAEAGARAKSAFLANMSHEIRTPMNGILGMAELLCTAGLAKQQEEQAEMLHRSAESLLTIVNDILDFSKIEAGQLMIERIPFSPVSELRDVIELLRPRLAGGPVAMVVHIDAAMPRRLIGDPVRLRQILTNLIGNAVKFTAAGRVSVSAVHGPDGLRLEVADTGIGMPAETVERLFQPFTQADASTTRRFGGTGLGLSICRRLVELIGGAIAVHSREGQGSVFTVSLPIAADPEGATADPAAIDLTGWPAGSAARPTPEAVQAAQAVASDAPRVLLAEDNPVNRSLAVALLRKAGVAVDVAVNGRAAVESVANGVFDLVLMDCQMPEMDGFEATAHIRSLERERGQGRRIPIIAVTANAMEGDRDRCLAAGMDDYLAKPIRRDALTTVLTRWLRSTDSR
jgi:two-component system, sensor histidine kinase and response regulator